MSIEFYNENAKNFYKDTVEADMSATYKEFESYVEVGKAILDLGCGSGRDSKYYIDRGYKVTSMDYSLEMVRMASELTGQEVLHQDMKNLKIDKKFYGIWACASVLHIPKRDIPTVLKNCHEILEQDGIMYLSFKYGEGETERKGRFFSNYTEETFNLLLEELKLFSLEKFWITGDVRPGREAEKWLNVIIRAY